jgi:hypothetical protein
MDKRHFLKFAGAGLALSPALSVAASASSGADASGTASIPSLSSLKPLTENVKPINVAERKARIENAQSLMKAQGIAAILIEPGAAMDYFSGMQWWRSERLTALIIPQKGDIAVVTPFFEKPSVLESLKVGDDVRVWQEHESPFDVVADILLS